MITFGFLYTDDGMTLYDVTRERRHDMAVYVASLSAAPGVSFAAATETEAVEQLKGFVHHRSRHNAHYLPAELPISA